MGRRCKLSPRGIYGFYGRNTRIRFREGSFDWKLKVLVHFLSVKRYWMVTSFPLLPNLFFPNASNRNFEIAIMLKIAQKSDNKNSGVDTTHQGQGTGVVSYSLGHIWFL